MHSVFLKGYAGIALHNLITESEFGKRSSPSSEHYRNPPPHRMKISPRKLLHTGNMQIFTLSRYSDLTVLPF